MPIRLKRRVRLSSLVEITRLLPDTPTSTEPESPIKDCAPANAQPSVLSPFLSIREAAEWLCVSRSTLKRLINSGDLTTVRVGKRRKISAASLSVYVTKDIVLPENVLETTD